MSTLFAKVVAKVMVDSDRDLLSLIAQDDVGAFKELYHRYWQVLVREADRRLHDLPASEDLVQDLFADLWNKRKKIIIHSSVKNYLYTAVKYQVYKYIDEQHRSAHYDPEVLEQSDEQTDDILSFEEIYHQIEVIIEKLPKRQQEIFKLSKFGQLTARQIAERLHIAPQTVNNKIHQSLHFIKAELKHFSWLLLALSLFSRLVYTVIF